MADAEDLKSSGRERPCGFNSHRRYSNESEAKRQDPFNSQTSALSKSTHSISSTRRKANQNGWERTQGTPDSTPTRNVVVADRLPSDLAEIVRSWDELPEAIRAGIVAMVRASKK
jgi:hypothetical protein